MNFCAIVDGCSTGKYLPKYLKEQGYNCIHIQSSPIQPAAAKKSFNPIDYQANLIFHGNFEELLSLLSPFPIEFVIPGSEPGVELANSLSTRLNLFSNGPAMGIKSRNKFLTGKCIQEYGLRFIKQHKATTVEEAILWAREHKDWPIAIKLLDSGGGDGFHICQNEDALRKAAQSVLGSKTIFNKTNHEILVQEYITGPEYVVNTVSHNSQHYVESFMTYRKKKLFDGSLIYETTSLIKSSDCAQSEEIFRYTLAVLDALGLKYGAAHNEVILTPTGPVLVECNARLMGNALPTDILSECLDHTQPELTALAYTHPKVFLEYIQKPHVVKSYMTMVHLIADEAGEIKSLDFPEEIKQLPTFYSLRLHYSVGDVLKKTIDLPTAPGEIFLKSTNKALIEADILRIRELEAKGFFKIDPKMAIDLSKSYKLNI